MTDIVEHVDATFGGKPVRFELYRDRETVAKLEQAVGSANAVWIRFATGTWSVGDVRAVLALAHPAPPPPHGSSLYHGLKRVAEVGQTVALIRGASMTPPEPSPFRPVRGVEPDAIDAVLGSRPMATYAALAAALMQAFMVGLPVALATFDERTALDKVRASLAPAAEPEGAAA